MAFPGGTVMKNPPANAGDAGLIPGSGSSLGEGNANPLQDSYLGNPMDSGAWRAKSRTRLSDWTTTATTTSVVLHGSVT